jgi:ADP-heptose:LPS heptosyltransferase
MSAEAFWLIRGGALGDSLLAFPALWRLRRAHPGARLFMVAAGELRDLLAPHVDSFIPLDDFGARLFLEGAPAPKGWEPGCRVALWMADPSGVARHNLTRWGASQLVYVAGFDTGVHVSQQLERSIAHWVLAAAEVPVLAVAGLPGAVVEQQPEVVIHPGSGSEAKNWPLDNFLHLAAWLSAMGLRVAFLLGPAEDSRGLAGFLEERGYRVIRGLSVTEVARLLSGARLYAGNDSGVSHLAGLTGIPTVAIFGPTDPAMWAPLGPKAVVVRGSDGAWPSPEQVIEAAERLLHREPAGSLCTSTV